MQAGKVANLAHIYPREQLISHKTVPDYASIFQSWGSEQGWESMRPPEGTPSIQLNHSIWMLQHHLTFLSYQLLHKIKVGNYISPKGWQAFLKTWNQMTRFKLQEGILHNCFSLKTHAMPSFIQDHRGPWCKKRANDYRVTLFCPTYERELKQTLFPLSSFKCYHLSFIYFVL